MRRLAALIAAASINTAAAQGIDALQWMQGSWVRESADETVRETWLGPANGVMVAANLTSTRNGRASYEFLRIANGAEGLSYFASPGGRAPVEFRLKESGERRVVFENPAHEFPRRILYWRDGEALMARIEGTLRGEPRSEEWRFVRAITRD
jgi:hypothetical protein